MASGGDLVELSTDLGKHVALCAKLSNTCDTELCALRVMVVTFQDYQNPSLPKPRNYAMEASVWLTGSETTCIGKLQPNETVQLQSGLLFLYPGVYRVELFVVPEERYQQMYDSEPLGMSVASIHDKLLDGAESINQACQCLHSIEFSVEDS